MDAFTVEQLERMRSLQYATNHTRRLVAECADLDDGFHRHLLAVSYDDAIAFDSVMTQAGGDPSGMEHRHSERAAWAFVLPDAANAGGWRVQTFEAMGFVGHECHRHLVDAVSDMVSRGFQVRDAGALDRMACAAEWARGMRHSELLQRLNSRQMTWDAFLVESHAMATEAVAA